MAVVEPAFERSRIDRCEKRRHVLLRWKRRRHWHIPDGIERTTVVGRSRSGIPRPLVHRNKVNTRVVLNQRLCSIAMMHIPVNNQHAVTR